MYERTQQQQQPLYFFGINFAHREYISGKRTRYKWHTRIPDMTDRDDYKRRMTTTKNALHQEQEKKNISCHYFSITLSLCQPFSLQALNERYFFAGNILHSRCPFLFLVLLLQTNWIRVCELFACRRPGNAYIERCIRSNQIYYIYSIIYGYSRNVCSHSRHSRSDEIDMHTHHHIYLLVFMYCYALNSLPIFVRFNGDGRGRLFQRSSFNGRSLNIFPRRLCFPAFLPFFFLPHLFVCIGLCMSKMFTHRLLCDKFLYYTIHIHLYNSYVHFIIIIFAL